MALLTNTDVKGGRSSSPPIKETTLVMKSSLSVMEVLTINTSGNGLSFSASSLENLSFTTRIGVFENFLFLLMDSTTRGSIFWMINRAADLDSSNSEGSLISRMVPKSLSFSKVFGNLPKE